MSKVPKAETFDMRYASKVSIPFLMKPRSHHAACNLALRALLDKVGLATRYKMRIQYRTDTQMPCKQEQQHKQS